VTPAASGALRARVLTALVLGVLLVSAVLGLPAVATQALVAAAMLAGAWEWSLFLRPASRAARLVYVVLVAIALAAAWLATRDPASLRAFLAAAAAWWVVALGWLALRPGRGGPLAAAIAGVLALVPCGVALAEFRALEPRGASLLLFALLLIVAADTGAFFVGRQLGRVRLAPQVSPGKTWEGAIGGVVLASVVAVAGARWFGLPPVAMLGIGVATAAFSIVGDLTESMFKRHTGLKDSGSLFPGHGGVLDRIDSVSAGAPVLLLGLLQIEGVR
jgi:phosphatidate cytidylyltransferase